MTFESLIQTVMKFFGCGLYERCTSEQIVQVICVTQGLKVIAVIDC